MCSICIPGSTVYYLIDGAYKLNVAQYTTCNMDEEQFMNIIKGALHILIIKPPLPHCTGAFCVRLSGDLAAYLCRCVSWC